MTNGLSRRGLGAGAAAAALAGLAAPAVLRADEPLRLRCSLDTAASHGRNLSMGDYLKKVEAASNGRIKGEVFSGGALFADLDVTKALLQGQVEMACPGAWTITGFIPDAELFQLPALYGQPIETVHKVIDGPVGKMVESEIEKRLRSQVLGPWLDLGYNNWYSTSKPLTGFDSLKGMKLRNSGGAGQAWRARFFGAVPITTAWPNVPLALSQGTFDGLSSTNESCYSSKLWDAGLKYGMEDHQFMGEYIPMVSLTFWNQLKPEEQKMMTDIWAQNIPTYRQNMAAAQVHARQELEAHNVKYNDPSAAQIAEERKRMLPDQDQLAKELKVSPEIVKSVMADVGTAA